MWVRLLTMGYSRKFVGVWVPGSKRPASDEVYSSSTY